MVSLNVLLAVAVLCALVGTGGGIWFGRSWYGYRGYYLRSRNPWRSWSGGWPSHQKLRFSGSLHRFGGPWTDIEDDKQDMEKPLDASDPNVCTVKKPITHWRCWDRRMRKTTRYDTEYKCCPGFERIPGKPGCPKELYVSTKNIPEVAEELGLNQFLKYAGKVSVAKLLRGKGPYTVFAPSDAAFAQLPKQIVEKMKNPKYARYYLQYHVVEGKHIAETLKNGMNLTSYEFSHPLRVSASHKGKMVLLEGANVSMPNQGASNGIIHVIDRVLTPPRLTIMELLERDERGRFTILQEALAQTSLNLTGQLTLFAPTDEAFEKLPKETITKLLKNKDCLETLLKYHFVRGFLFSKTVRPSESMTIRTLEGPIINVKRNESDDLMINAAVVSEENIRASDGVIHVIDDVLLISTAMDLVSLTEHLKLTEFSKLLKTTNLTEKLEGRGPFTLFAPTNKAFEKVPGETKQLLMRDPELLQKILEYHVVQGMWPKKQFTNDLMLATLDKPNKIRINVYRYRMVMCVDGSCINRTDIHACNGIIHIIDGVLVPTTDNLLQILDTDPRVSFFRSMVTTTTMLAKLEGTDPTTIFAPSNEAFEKLSDEEMEDILKDNLSTEAFIKRHMVHGTVYSSSITCQRRQWMYYWSCPKNYLNSLEGNLLVFKKCTNQALRINNIKVNATDIDATNGVLHVIHDILKTPKSWSPYSSVGFWGSM